MQSGAKPLSNSISLLTGNNTRIFYELALMHQRKALLRPEFWGIYVSQISIRHFITQGLIAQVSGNTIPL
jgi:hypothetical protein